MHTLIKYAKRWYVFICEFIDAIKLTEVELHWFYVDPFCKYENFIFNEFTIIYEHYNELLPFT
jgi:hypothetical protein